MPDFELWHSCGKWAIYEDNYNKIARKGAECCGQKWGKY
jgi:hypothetical protein